MPRIRRVLSGATVVAVLLGSGVATAAQDAAPCPAKHACLEYEGQVIEVDVALGPYQILIIEDQRTVTESLFSEDKVTERAITGLGLAETGDDSFEVDRLYHEPREGIFADADLGDVYVIGKSVAD